ncbi:adenylosuccinate synthase [Pseudothermotoga thermarum]|uniref:Adenylosuccinate synthetase n=1 Tax=Pseudothermotoga thermarum DSM 5069 TaxID=688269 RepID=F7YWC6_9THEM|nr:adenylosuccinate synthase [Pseudothermotoga thermarum]AEH51904.1 Adenylosuccinate synthetase [Pseudothermotoga thermarum DSM 5069]
MNAAVIGLQWGDEGKGKVVTYLSKDFDCVVRYSGGSNAGHTVDYGDFKVVHHLVPSANVKKQKMMYIGSGVVIDLQVLLEEIEQLEKMVPGSRNLLRISNQAHVVLPIYRELDAKIDSSRLSTIGTTRRGIGLSYASKALRCGLRLEDLQDEETTRQRIQEIVSIWKLDVNLNEIVQDLYEKYERIKDLIINTVEAIRTLAGKSLLFEGTQGVLLDVDAGTYPFVTSTNCSSTGIQSGFGYPVVVDEIFGVFKAYTTRVGEGPFPTELKGEEGEKLRKLGGEYGATTGRPRRCGWLDLVLLKYAVEVSGCKSLILTKSDVLCGYGKIGVCVAYKVAGKILEAVDNLSCLSKAQPIYEYLDGWSKLSSKQFEKFIEKVEKATGARIVYISTGPRVDEMVKL